MKFIFDRAVKSRNDGYTHVHMEFFEGKGPWVKQGIEYANVEDWVEHAKKLGRALGITECECGLMPSVDSNTYIMFSFRHEDDQMKFLVAACGDEKRAFKRDCIFSSPTERSQAITKVVHFMEQNEIKFHILDSGNANTLRLMTKSRFDDFTFVQAFKRGEFKATTLDQNIDALAHSVK